jgi:hypothetical protein
MTAELRDLSQQGQQTTYQAFRKTTQPQQYRARDVEEEEEEEEEDNNDDNNIDNNIDNDYEEAIYKTESEDGELPDAFSASGDSDDDCEPEVRDSSLSRPQGMHHSHDSSAKHTTSLAVAEFLELCFQLNTALITDRFSHGRPQT